jgi:acid phosphatase family membrane protein YuiD
MSPIFGLAFLVAIIVMHDATGVRRETGKQARLLIEVLTTLNGIISERDRIVRRQKLKTMVGHTPMQVFFGALFGILVATAYILIFGIEYGAYA